VGLGRWHAKAGLVSGLRRRLAAAGAGLATTDELGLPADDKEAHAFTLLAWLTWHGLPVPLPTLPARVIVTAS